MKAVLALEDGTIFIGESFGYPSETSGEVVFNTGMVGYTESLTDPSYFGQILVQTYVLVGCYGVPPFSLTDENKIPLHFESESIKVKGYVVSELQKIPSHWACEKSLDEWLYEQKIPGISGIDTRKLTKKLRIKGTMLGMIKVGDFSTEEIEEEVKKVQDPNKLNLVEEVSIKKPIEYKTGERRIVLIDCGVKLGIVRSLLERKINLIRVPYDYPTDKILDYQPEGIVVSNGPGDPKKCEKTVENVRELLETEIPILGICLGNQTLALASGANTYKLKFGHRGQNHPVIDLETKKCYITSQNHGYAVEPASLKDTEFKAWFLNANDKTIEGIKHKTKNIFGVQFHPEASPGPLETNFIFDMFLEKVTKCQN